MDGWASEGPAVGAELRGDIRDVVEGLNRRLLAPIWLPAGDDGLDYATARGGREGSPGREEAWQRVNPPSDR